MTAFIPWQQSSCDRNHMAHQSKILLSCPLEMAGPQLQGIVLQASLLSLDWRSVTRTVNKSQVPYLMKKQLTFPSRVNVQPISLFLHDWVPNANFGSELARINQACYWNKQHVSFMALFSGTHSCFQKSMHPPIWSDRNYFPWDKKMRAPCEFIIPFQGPDNRSALKPDCTRMS